VRSALAVAPASTRRERCVQPLLAAPPVFRRRRISKARRRGGRADPLAGLECLRTRRRAGLRAVLMTSPPAAGWQRRRLRTVRGSVPSTSGLFGRGRPERPGTSGSKSRYICTRGMSVVATHRPFPGAISSSSTAISAQRGLVDEICTLEHRLGTSRFRAMGPVASTTPVRVCRNREARGRGPTRNPASARSRFSGHFAASRRSQCAHARLEVSGLRFGVLE